MSEQRITYEQAQRFYLDSVDLADIIRLMRPKIEAIQADGRNVCYDLLRNDQIGFHWDRGN